MCGKPFGPSCDRNGCKMDTRMGQEGAREAQVGPKMVQVGPKMGQEGTQTGQEGAREAQVGPKSGQDPKFNAIWATLGACFGGFFGLQAVF